MCIRDSINCVRLCEDSDEEVHRIGIAEDGIHAVEGLIIACLLYTSDAADERSSVDLGGRRIIKKQNRLHHSCGTRRQLTTDA